MCLASPFPSTSPFADGQPLPWPQTNATNYQQINDHQGQYLLVNLFGKFRQGHRDPAMISLALPSTTLEVGRCTSRSQGGTA